MGLRRRAFLAGAALVAGGVAFGVHIVRREPENPLVPGPGEAAITPYVLVTAAGVTVIVPRAEMGQGVQTTLAALVAEEMDLAWDGFEVAHGPPGAAYYNGAAAAIGLPFAEYRESQLLEIGRDVAALASRLVGLQLTGGSSSTIDAFERMRIAGAAARAVMLEAAAAELVLPAAALATREGRVEAPDGRSLAYAELAATARGIAPPADPPLKPRSAWRLLGSSLPRKDIAAKGDGSALFGIDVRLDGIRFAAIRSAPRLGARRLGHDAAALGGMAGVEKVIALDDAVAVVADNTWRAIRAVEAIEVDWGPAPYPAETDGIFAVIDAAFDDGANSTLRDDGDVGAALAAAGSGRIEAEYRVPYLAHATMEPMNATARLADGRLELWVGNQAPMLVRRHAAAAVGLPPEAVTVHTPLLGGGFGRRAEVDVAVQAARIAAAMPGIPVKLTWTREEDTRHDFYRPGAIARASGVPGRTGPEAMELRIAAPSVTRSQVGRLFGFAPPGPDKLLVEGAFDQPYEIPNYRVRGHVAEVAVPIGAWRSVGNSYNAFFHECFLDELILAGGGDPVETRLALMRNESPEAARVLETVAEMANWGAPLPEGIGRGVAFTQSFGTPTAQIVEVRQAPGGVRIAKVWCAQDVGLALDPRNLEAQAISGILYGLSAAVSGEITFRDGAVVEGNFNDYDALRMHQSPAIEVRILEEQGRMSGAGEPSTPPAAPALANAIFALTGERHRSLPLGRHLRFV